MRNFFVPLVFSVCAALGCQADDAVKLAVMCPLTTSSKTFGIGHLQGVSLALEQYARSSELRVDTIIVDDQSDPERALELVSALDSKGIAALLGPCNSAVAEVLLQRNRVPFPIVSSLTTASRLTRDEALANPDFFRANIGDRRRLGALLEAMFRTGEYRPAKLALVYEYGDAFGEGMKDDAVAWLKSNEPRFHEGSVVVASYERDLSEEDAIGTIERLLDKGVGSSSEHAYMFLGLATDARTLISASIAKKVDAQFYFNEPNHLVFAASAEQGLDVAGLRVFTIWDPANRSLHPFKETFRTKYAEEPSFAASLAYDATLILLSAVERAAGKLSSTGSLAELRASVRRELNEGRFEDLRFVLDGSHVFENGEYENLSFRGVMYDRDGSLISWDKPLSAPLIKRSQTHYAVVLPPLHVFFIVIATALIGSLVRRIGERPHHARVTDIVDYFLSLRTIVIGPVVALVIFCLLFLIALTTDYAFLNSGDDTVSIYRIAGGTIGFFGGYFGLITIHAAARKLEMDEERDAGATAEG